MTSLSTIKLGVNRNTNDENQSELSRQTVLHSSTVLSSRFQTTSSSFILQPITTNNSNIQYNPNDYQNEEQEHLLSVHYDSNRLKQERLLFFANIFRLLVIFTIAPIIYFLV